MEKTFFSVGNIEVAQKVIEVKSLKAEFASKEATIQEDLRSKDQLEDKLAHLQEQIDELKQRQYQIFRQMVDEEFKNKELLKNIKHIEEAVQNQNRSQTSLLEELARVDDEKIKMAQRLANLSLKQSQICSKQQAKNDEISRTKRKIKSIDQDNSSYEKDFLVKEERIRKLKQLILYYEDKQKQLRQINLLISSKIKEENSIGDQKEKIIEKKCEQQALIRMKNQANQRESLELKKNIQNQRFNKNMLSKKLLILQQKVQQLQKQQQVNRVRLNQRKIFQQRTKENKIALTSQWLSVCQKIELQTSYSRYYAKKVTVS